jgi:hypothetical protein
MTEGNQLTGKLFQENLEIAKAHLKQATATNKYVFLKWHDRLMVQAGMNALENFRAGLLFKAMKSGVYQNPLWIFYFLAEITRSLPGFISRGGKTRSAIINKSGS